MDFSVSDKMKAVLDLIREFVERELIPLEGEFLRRDFRDLLPLLNEKREEVKRMELWAPNQPASLGGMGLDLVEHGLVSEELGRTPLGHYVFNCQAPDAGNMEILHKYGTEEQKERYLKPLVEGRIRSCFSMTEVDRPGSNPVLLDTTAVRDKDEWVINGRKWYTTAADGSAFAIVMAVTDPDAPPHLRASMIIVPTDAEGFHLVRNIPVMGHTGSDYFSHAEILYQNCRVPAGNLLGPQGWGFVIAQERLGPGRIHHCMRWLGICRRAFEVMCRRAAERVVTADGRTLATRQIIQSWIAEGAAEIQAARLMTLHTAWKIEHLGVKEAREEISLIKFFVADVMQRVVDRALQVHGGLGMTDDTIIAFFYRHERGSRIYDGADEVHKVAAARRIIREGAQKRWL
ncbi:MAG TPA: acyl-CoA dehydrogenase family protein [Syntrophales bacterium]|nr:acyl-CoA dehydrogenase family protein [Syntrophales bacterium]HOM08002.1 acyl-CoA dehydrogenase family protein [Syntrophales bacterium]HOO00628.1 acyl-CoA dehydrogenase family protein [Syntrophales bacterium]HPC01882.1 acyl-CoA dehydrogenase family protein [Syntrophales bacterium]HPQ05834.1 acyl-CoA dehydrogenase family protein [Syntrophales bacterium]